MLFLQQQIEEQAAYVTDQLDEGTAADFLTYPSNGGLTEVESASLEKLRKDPILKSALRKIIADSAAGVLFELFNLIDGTIDPEEHLGEWSSISLVDTTEAITAPAEMLHDELYAKYGEWQELRPEKNWRLDSLE